MVQLIKGGGAAEVTLRGHTGQGILVGVAWREFHQ